jgi:hypothetical protein
MQVNEKGDVVVRQSASKDIPIVGFGSDTKGNDDEVVMHQHTKGRTSKLGALQPTGSGGRQSQVGGGRHSQIGGSNEPHIRNVQHGAYAIDPDQ